MYIAHYLSPMIPSFNIGKTTSFFIDLLEFTLVRDDKTYVILSKDNLTVHVLRAGAHIGEMEIYLQVDDIDKLWIFIKDRLTGIHFKEPFNREYGMREVHILVPETKTLLFIGQEIK